MKKVYHNTTGTVCVTLIADVYVMCMCRVILMHAKEGAGGSRWEGEDGVDALYIYIT